MLGFCLFDIPSRTLGVLTINTQLGSGKFAGFPAAICRYIHVVLSPPVLQSRDRPIISRPVTAGPTQPSHLKGPIFQKTREGPNWADSPPTPERDHIRRCSDTLFIATRPSIKYHIHAPFTLVLTLSDARRIRVQYG